MQNFDHFEALTCIRYSNIGTARRIVHRISKKPQERKKTVENATISDNTDVVLNELGRQVPQTYRAALAIHTYEGKDQRVANAFRITFSDRQCSRMFLNAGSYT